ncbi:hypothetical protein RM844_21020 [Streptomyces sp. DSM 44915]|uniref:Shikimate dehydrogenase n=1 Tax=Streptomyces chisholmiae TaxID=3075540 RepID=A0ABU2JUW2_9ACTN|nr:hypothetical protein [Streptomyces sp. DSM 44915]MDT0268773.1 hypothetical protein [Streptomyces sp. DSM 44915]
MTTESRTRVATPHEAVARCLAEVGLTPDQPPAARPPAVLAAIGTTAPHALAGRLLRDALAAERVEVDRALPFDDPAALLASPDWRLALVLSPWKKQVATLVDELTPSAAGTGVVDTVVRDRAGRLLGVNTNSWAAQAAMETLLGGEVPAGTLVLGSGGSAGSVALAARRAWPAAPLVGSARNAAALAAWAADFEARPAAPDALPAVLAAGDAPSLIVNTTTWGETDASEERPFAFPLPLLLAPGRRLFDLNNRVSALQHAALEAGMSVMSGTYMQRVTNRCRAALLAALAS